MGTKKKRSGVQYNPKGATQGNTLVCHKTGDPIDCVEDASGKQRLCVDADLSADNIEVTVDKVKIWDEDGDILEVEPDGSINVNVNLEAGEDSVSIGAHANQVFDQASDTITTVNFETIYSFVPALNSTRIIKIDVTISTNSLIRLKLNGTIIKVKRTSPSERNIVFEFKEHRKVGTADTVIVEAKVDRFFTSKSPYTTFSSLEGYIE